MPAPSPDPAVPAHRFTFERVTINSKSAQYRILRDGVTYLEHVTDEPMIEFFGRLAVFLNRDRRPVVFLEDKIFQMRESLIEMADLVRVLSNRMGELVRVIPADKKNEIKWAKTILATARAKRIEIVTKALE